MRVGLRGARSVVAAGARRGRERGFRVLGGEKHHRASRLAASGRLRRSRGGCRACVLWVEHEKGHGSDFRRRSAGADGRAGAAEPAAGRGAGGAHVRGGCQAALPSGGVSVDVRLRDQTARAVRGGGVPAHHGRTGGAAAAGGARAAGGGADPAERGRPAGGAPHRRKRRATARARGGPVEARGRDAGSRAGAAAGCASAHAPAPAASYSARSGQSRAARVGGARVGGARVGGARIGGARIGGARSGGGHAARAGQVQGAVHRQRRARGEDRARQGAPASQDPVGRHGGHLRRGDDCSAREAREDALCRHRSAPERRRRGFELAPRACRRSAGGLGARRGPLRVRRPPGQAV